MDSNNFSLSWRFTDIKYANLPESDLIKIINIDAEEVNKKWKEIFGTIRHLMEIRKETDIDYELIEKIKINWDEKKSANELFDKVKASKNEELYFFWNNIIGVKTEWSIFKSYWNDFCYPDDDNNVIFIEEKNILITFCEEVFIYYKKHTKTGVIT